MEKGTAVTLRTSGLYARRAELGHTNIRTRLTKGLHMTVYGPAGEYGVKVLCMAPDGKIYSVPVRDLEVRKEAKV